MTRLLYTDDSSPAMTLLARSPGQPLDTGARDLMEARLGHDFSGVRVHSDPEAVQAARHVDASAFTVGHDVVFGANAPSPQRKDGWRLLAHELAHVVQQRAGGPGSAEAGLDAEQEADAAATAISEGNTFAVQTRTGVTLARGGSGGPPATSPLTLPAEGVDMPWEPGKGTSSKLGYLRDSAFFWARFRAAYGERLSPANQTRIDNDQAPIVDSQWVKYYPQHAAYLGETLEHHHVGQGSRAVPLPETLHDAYTVFHPQRRVVGTPTSGTRELPPRPTRQDTQAEISRHVTEEHIRGQGITPESPPSAPAVPVSSEVAGLPRGTVTAEGSLGGVRMGTGRVAGQLAANLLPALLIGVARAWLSYEKNVEDPKTEALRDLMEKKVMPAARRALSEHWRDAEELTAKSPEFPVYANITVDLDLTWDSAETWDVAPGPGPSHIDDSFKDAVDTRFVDLRVSFNNISKKETIALGSRLDYHPTETQRVTYSVEVDFGETPAQHTSRVLAHDAAAAARRGIPARDVAEHSHFAEDLTPADAREEQKRQTVGLPSLAKERERQQRKQLVLAYIDYTFEHDLDKQYVGAVRYLKELEQRDAAEEAASVLTRLRQRRP